MNISSLRFLVILSISFAVTPMLWAQANPGDDLQAILDLGDDLVLLQGAVYEVAKTLRYKKAGQRIYTQGARFPSEYATLKIADDSLMMLINGSHVEGVILENVICDGNRYELGVVDKPNRIGGGGQPAMVHFGANGGDRTIIRNNVFMNTRTWSTVKMHEGASGMLTENNIIFSIGVDPRGNGRETNEIPFTWSDGVSCAATDSVIRNNLIIDPTDVGIVLYGAPGTVVENNAIATISRESMGGINLVDPLELYAIDKEKNIIDYRGVKIRNNYIDAFGARIHMSIPVGCAVWVPHWKGKILLGGEVSYNTIAGDASAYGIVAHGISEWTIMGNISTGKYSGLAEYGDHRNPPDGPAPFLFDKPSVVDSELQTDFVPVERHIDHLLRTQMAPIDQFGYQMHDYGHYEIQAVVNAAYIEMLGRDPTEREFTVAKELLESRQRNADGLRRTIMNTKEFMEKNGDLNPNDLHPFRNQLWFEICDKIIREQGGTFSAVALYKDGLAALYRN
ncbi:MAG: hypothetical protein AAGB06_07055 [Verrucomicrobiota bacterium]